MKKFVLICVLLCPSFTLAQTTLVVNDRITVDAEKTIGLKRGATTLIAEENSRKLNAWLRNTSNANHEYYAITFPGGDWHFGADTTVYAGGATINGTCIQTPALSNFGFYGATGHTRDGNIGSNLRGTRSTNIIFLGPKLTLESLTLSVTGASEIVTVTAGYTVKAQDVGMTINITGGTNAKPNWYVVMAADPVAKTWTLNEACTTDSTTSLTGRASYTLWRDNGYQTVYKGMNWFGARQSTLTRCNVLVHINPLTDDSLNQGKHSFDNCSTHYGVVHYLVGRDMQKAWQRATGVGAADAYPGASDFHADCLHWRNCYASNGIQTIYIRNTQSVNNTVYNFTTYEMGTNQNPHDSDADKSRGGFLYSERGGEFTAQAVYLNGNRGTLLRLGECSPNSGLYRFQDVGFDGDTRIPWMLACDGEGAKDSTRATVIFDGVQMDGNDEDAVWDDETIINAKGALSVVCKNFVGRGLRANSLKLTAHEDDVNYKPQATIENCVLSGIVDQEDVIAAGSAATSRVYFKANHSATNAIFYDTEELPSE